jgi:hypothetical protein
VQAIYMFRAALTDPGYGGRKLGARETKLGEVLTEETGVFTFRYGGGLEVLCELEKIFVERELPDGNCRRRPRTVSRTLPAAPARQIEVLYGDGKAPRVCGHGGQPPDRDERRSYPSGYSIKIANSNNTR